MTFPTEAQGNLPTIQGKIMAVPTEAQGNLPTIQWQENDSSDRKKKQETCLLFNSR